MGLDDRVQVERLDVAAFEVPTEAPESDGTLAWDATTLVVVELRAAGIVGLGYSYAHRAAVPLIRGLLEPVVLGRSAWDVAGARDAAWRAVRNLGHGGLAAAAISAVDAAMWDLKARLLELPLVSLLGAVHPALPVYGSGGFTSYDTDRLCAQLAGWVEAGATRVKMKVGRDPVADPARVRAARAAIGRGAELFVDANGAYARKQALRLAERFAEEGVTWFEEPVSSDDVAGLRLLVERAPPQLAIAAGEYGYDVFHFRALLEAGAVDVLQLDCTRCLGITGFLEGAALAAAHHVPVSSHTAPALHLHPCLAARAVIHLEHFFDHARIEARLFEGAPVVERGMLRADRRRPGHGLRFLWSEAEPYRIA